MTQEKENGGVNNISRVSDASHGIGKKIICIGECALDIVFDGSQPVGCMPSGRIANAATILSRMGMPVYMMGEAGDDAPGRMVTGMLSDAGVNLDAVDRFNDGHTAVNLFIPAPTQSPLEATTMEVTRYDDYPAEGFDVVWPRVDAGDIVVFGGYYALAPRTRQRLQQFLAHLAERKVIVVYLPGYLPVQEPRITRVMPALLENLEMADVVITRNHDLSLIFGVSDAEGCYNDHIDFYCRNLINIDKTGGQIAYYAGKRKLTADIPAEECGSMMWNAGAVAGVLEGLFTSGVDTSSLEDTPEETMKTVLSKATALAEKTAGSLKLAWQKHD